MNSSKEVIDVDVITSPQNFSYMQGDGVRIEVIIDLANEAGVDPWINIPHVATDAYIEYVVNYVKENRNPNLTVTVEYGNEIWNTLFTSSSDLHKLGQDIFAGASEDFDVRLNYYGMRASQTMKIFSETFGEEGADRLVRCLGTQTDNSWVTEQILTAPLWAAYPSSVWVRVQR